MLRIILCVALCVGVTASWLPLPSVAQSPAKTAPQAANPTVAATSIAAGNTPLPVPLSDLAGQDDLVLKHLNAILTWYHNTGNQAPSITLPTDAIYQSNARSIAEDVVQSAFQAATADAALIARAAAPENAAEPAGDVSKLAPPLESQIAQLKSQIETLTAQISQTNGAKAQSLLEQKIRLQGQLELLTAEDAAIEQLAKYSANNAAAGGTSLQKSIAQLQRSVPEINTSPSPAKKTAAPGAALTTAPQESGGLISESEELLAQANGLHKIDLLNQQAANAEDLARQLRTPLIAQIHRTLALAASWASTTQTAAAQATATPAAKSTQPPTQSSSQATAPTKQQFDALTTEFKQLSAAALPLSQEIIDLDQSRTNLTQWRVSLAQENSLLLRKVLTRVGLIALSIGIIFLLSVLSNRLIFRYITDVRRRRQVLILRRFIVGFLMGIVVILGFVSEISSLATFAGFITAGIAVGLQTILLSVAAYFLIIGRYGIRVGDRISISGTTGDVIEVGLVRLYMMELAGTGNDLFPTGRIIVFPNSVLFQATVPLYKQIPGTEYAWHEVAATVTPGIDARPVQEQMLAAVNSVHESYRGDFERQHTASARALDVRIEVPKPITHLQFAATGLEVVVRYPVALGNVAKADDEVTQKLVSALNSIPEFKAAIVGAPQIRVAVKG
jgi:small-conductance mechanosensitive channel